ncbi:MAG: ABC transporter permease, partial [Rhodothermales bacterium]|nr:ABC transporter permease [Rhodothermales bacterium]
MLQNYLKIALRTLRRSPGYALLNIAGLALGLAACLLIGLYVQDEHAYDRFHERGDCIFRVSQRVEQPGDEALWAWTGGRMAPAIEADFPAVEAAVRLHRSGAPVRYVDEADATRSRAFREDDVLFADPDFFDVFTFRAVQGDLATALEAPGSVVLTRSTARRYFGQADPLGKTLSYDGRLPLRVTAVVEDVPAASHFTFDLLAPMAAFKQLAGMPVDAEFGSFWWPSTWTYVLLRDAGAAAEIEPQLRPFINRYRENTEYIPTLEPLHDLYLRSAATSTPEPTSSLATVRIFVLIALAVLLLACINFVNLATARSARRAREVGVRKVAGAARGQLIRQFLGESILLSLVALGLAVGLVELLLPAFNAFTGRTLAAGYADNGAFWAGLAALVVFTGIAGGAYPAFYLAGFRPARVLKGTGPVRGGHAGLRKGLVVFQFAVSTALIVGTLVAYGQLRFLQNARLGFDDEQLVTVLVDDTSGWDALDAAFRSRPEVRAVSAAGSRPGIGYAGDLPFEAEGATFDDGEQPRIGTESVGYGYFEMLGLEMVAGRSFSRAYPADAGIRPNDSPHLHVFERGMILNEAAVRWIGWTPEEALGKTVRYYAYENGTYYTDIRGTVVGVVQDYHTHSLHRQIEPVVYTLAEAPQ